MLSIREEVSLPSIPEEIGKIFKEIYEYMMKKGIAPMGPPFSCWHGMNDRVFDMESGFPVRCPAEGEGRIKRSTLPGGRAAVAMHIGPYDSLAGTYQALESWIKENGYQAEAYLWEVYMTDPCQEPDPSKWMTRVYWPIK